MRASRLIAAAAAVPAVAGLGLLLLAGPGRSTAPDQRPPLGPAVVAELDPSSSPGAEEGGPGEDGDVSEVPELAPRPAADPDDDDNDEPDDDGPDDDEADGPDDEKDDRDDPDDGPDANA